MSSSLSSARSQLEDSASPLGSSLPPKPSTGKKTKTAKEVRAEREAEGLRMTQDGLREMQTLEVASAAAGKAALEQEKLSQRRALLAQRAAQAEEEGQFQRAAALEHGLDYLLAVGTAARKEMGCSPIQVAEARLHRATSLLATTQTRY